MYYWREFQTKKDVIDELSGELRQHWNTSIFAAIEEHERGGKQCFPLGKILSRYGHSKCTDPRDKVFAYLSTLPKDEHGILS